MGTRMEQRECLEMGGTLAGRARREGEDGELLSQPNRRVAMADRRASTTPCATFVLVAAASARTRMRSPVPFVRPSPQNL